VLLIEASGVEGEDIIDALVSAISKTIVYDAPDRQTAFEWNDMVGYMLDSVIANSDADGSASWSRSRYH
jgi:hypothetical protein